MSRRHRCPGHPNRLLPRNRFACTDCWDRLPEHLRRPILATLGKPGSRGKTEAWNTAAAYLGSRNCR